MLLASFLTVKSPSTDGEMPSELPPPPMTTCSLRLAKWLAEYAQLVAAIRSDAGAPITQRRHSHIPFHHYSRLC